MSKKKTPVQKLKTPLSGRINFAPLYMVASLALSISTFMSFRQHEYQDGLTWLALSVLFLAFFLEKNNPQSL